MRNRLYPHQRSTNQRHWLRQSHRKNIHPAAMMAANRFFSSFSPIQSFIHSTIYGHDCGLVSTERQGLIDKATARPV